MTTYMPVHQLTLLCVGFLVYLLTSATPSEAYECGVAGDASNRVVGGEETTPHVYPWMVELTAAVWSFWGQKTTRLLCGATLIHPRFVLTAAHCFDNTDKSAVNIHLGVHHLSTSTEGANVIKSHDIDEVIIHERYQKYRRSAPFFDIALIRLRVDVPFTSTVRPICLPPPGNRDAYDGMEAIVAGWGQLSEVFFAADVLHHVSLRVLPMAECRRRLPYSVNDYNICTLSWGRDACQGDSGGPLMFLNNNSRFEQIGIVSWGFGCASPDNPGVFSSVSDFLPWIQEHIQNAEQTTESQSLYTGEYSRPTQLPFTWVYYWLTTK